MKKSLLTLFFVATLGATAAMAGPLSLEKGKKIGMPHKAESSKCFTNAKAAGKALMHKAPVNSDLWMNWGYCYEPYNAFMLEAGTIKGAIMITKDVATQFAGAEISAVQVANPTNS